MAIRVKALLILSLVCLACQITLPQADAKKLRQVGTTTTQLATAPRCRPPNVSLQDGSKTLADQPTKFKWQTRDPECKGIRFLVGSFPNAVRFAGKGFFALPPNENGPNGLDWDKDRTRIFIPIHYGLETASGSVSIRFLETGKLNVRWSYAEFTKFRGGKVKALVDISEADLLVGPGTPEMRIVDRFPDDLPEAVYLDASGFYRLQVWSHRYRVTERRTGVLIVERDGDRPAFSPTGRFVLSFRRDGHAVEVTDVLTRKVEGFLGNSDSQYGYGRIDAIAWGASDAFLVVGQAGYGSISVWQTLIDRVPVVGSNLGGPVNAWMESTVEIDVDLGVVWRSFIDDDESSPDKTLLGAFGVDDDGDGEFIFKRLSPLIGGITKEDVPRDPPWHLPGKPVLTHGTTVVTLGPSDSDEITKYYERFRASQEPYFLEPILDSVVTPVGPARVVSQSVPRGMFASLIDENKHGIQRLVSRLADFGINLAPSENGLVAFAQQSDEDDRARLQRLLGFLGAFFDRFPSVAQSFHKDDSPCMTAMPFDELIDPLGITNAWTWEAGGMSVALLQSQCDVGNGGLSGNGALHLVVKNSSGDTQVVDLVAEIIKRKTDAAGKIFADEFDTLGLSEKRAVSSFLIGSRYIAVVGTDRSFIVYDIVAMSLKYYIMDIPGGDIVDSLSLTKDDRYLVQGNGDGQLFLYRFEDGRRVLSGYFINDEVVLYTADGFFDATFEGASFVNVRFPGILADFSLSQFDEQLRRPSVIHDIIAGKGIAPTSPSILIPPTVRVAIDREASFALIPVRVEAQAEDGLARIDVYTDGVLDRQIAISGASASTVYDLVVPQGTRRADFVAVDSKDMRSSAASIEFDASSLAPFDKRRLRVIAVGTDIYDDPRLSRLSYAAVDAQNFAKVAADASHRYYGSAEVISIIDGKDLGPSLLAAIGALKADSAPHDTVMLFASGHGLRDERGELYVAGRSTRVNDISRTALSWDEIVEALQGINGRVFVFLDICHAGAAGATATNDVAAARLVRSGKAITVFAASKGRQNSLEDAGLKGGVFTTALAAVVADTAGHDLNRNGTVDIFELYRAVKSSVVFRTNGEQTPWMARNAAVGDVPLF